MIAATAEVIGIAHYAAQLVTALGSHCDVTLIAPEELGRIVDPPAKLVEMRVPEHRYDPRYIWKTLRMAWYIRRQRPDIFHVQDTHPLMCLLALLVRGPKVVVTLHDVTAHPGDEIWYRNIATNLLVRRADALVVHGEQIAKQFRIRYPQAAHKLHVSFHPIRTTYKKWSNPDTREEKNVLVFGRIVKYKGLDILLQAAPRFHEAAPDYTIVIVGGGDATENLPLIEKYKDFIKLENRRIADEEVAGFFQASAFVVMPYLEASESGVLSTSYAFERPVIVTRVGSLYERVEHGGTGLIIPPGDADALADAMIQMANNDELRRRMSAQIRDKVLHEYSWEVAARRALDTYRSVLGPAKKPFSGAQS